MHANIQIEIYTLFDQCPFSLADFYCTFFYFLTVWFIRYKSLRKQNEKKRNTDKKMINHAIVINDYTFNKQSIVYIKICV